MHSQGLDKVQQTIIENWRHERLAHFYLITAHEAQQDKTSFLKDWTTQTLSEIWKLEGKNLSQDWLKEPSFYQHPDFTIIDIEGARALVDSPEVVQWQQQLDYQAMELKNKWVVWHECEKITESLANKLLKTLEEPPKKTIILFTSSEKAPLLATIESRAIKIRLPLKDDQSAQHALKTQENESFCDYLERIANLKGDEFLLELTPLLRVGELQETLDFLKKNKAATHMLITYVLDYERSKNSSLQALDALNKRLQWFKKAETFNQGPAQRWLTLLSPYL